MKLPVSVKGVCEQFLYLLCGIHLLSILLVFEVDLCGTYSDSTMYRTWYSN